MPSLLRNFAIFLCVPFLFSVSSLAQQLRLPKEIRGYRIHDAKVGIQRTPADPRSSDADARISFGEPRFVSASVSGITFKIPVEASPLNVNGIIDLLEFYDFRVNGIPVEIEEFNGPIALKKGETLQLPKSAMIFVASSCVVQAAWNELTNSKKEWLITGRVFVLGRFKKLRMSFRRAIPVDVQVTIKNPLPGLT